MLRIVLIFGWLMPAVATYAQSLTVTQPVRLHSIIQRSDLAVLDPDAKDAAININQIVGLEAKRALYPGQTLKLADFGPISVIERNSEVRLIFNAGALSIRTNGRSLSRGSIGDRVRVMNSDSRTIVTGIVIDATTVQVGE